MIDSVMVVCRWLAVIRYMELMNVLHHRRQYLIQPVSSRFVSVCLRKSDIVSITTVTVVHFSFAESSNHSFHTRCKTVGDSLDVL